MTHSLNILKFQLQRVDNDVYNMKVKAGGKKIQSSARSKPTLSPAPAGPSLRPRPVSVLRLIRHKTGNAQEPLNGTEQGGCPAFKPLPCTRCGAAVVTESKGLGLAGRRRGLRQVSFLLFADGRADPEEWRPNADESSWAGKKVGDRRRCGWEKVWVGRASLEVHLA